MKITEHELFAEVQKSLKYLAISGVRVKILLSLKTGPKNLSELRNEIGIRSSTILHSMSDIEKRQMVYKEGDSYHLTQIGELMAVKLSDVIKSLVSIKKFEKLWFDHKLDGIPDELKKEIGLLSNSLLVESEPEDLTKPHITYLNLLKTSKKVIGASPVFHSDFPELIITLALQGTKIDLIITKDVMSKLYEIAASDLATFQKIMANDNFNLWITEEDLNVAFTVTDKFFSLGLFFADGSYDYSVDLVSEDENAILWGEKLFKYYLKKSKQL